MGKFQKNQSGFGAVEGLLILIIVGILGFTGWYVYHSQQNTSKNLTPTSSGTPMFKKNSKTTSKTSTVNTSTQAYKGTITLGGADYSFSAPADWKISNGGSGDFYQNSTGDILFVGENQTLDTPTTDYVWQADTNTTNGITILDKSTGCQPAPQSTFNGFSYACSEDTSTTTVVVFVAAQGGEVPLGKHMYVINYHVPKKPGADFSTFQTILSTFRSK